MPQASTALDIGTREVVCVARQVPVDEAARLMRERHVGSLVVVDETQRGRRVVGMLTDRDIVTGIVAQGVAPQTLRVEDVVGTGLVTARADDAVIDLLAKMRRHGVRRLPVVDAQGMLVALVCLDDLLRVVAKELHLVVQAIESGLEREPIARP